MGAFMTPNLSYAYLCKIWLVRFPVLQDIN